MSERTSLGLMMSNDISVRCSREKVKEKERVRDLKNQVLPNDKLHPYTHSVASSRLLKFNEVSSFILRINYALINEDRFLCLYIAYTRLTFLSFSFI